MGRLGFILLGILSWIAIIGDGATDPSDVSALVTLYGRLNNPSQLTGWSSNSQADPCGGEQWKGVTCSGSSVTELVLSGLGLNGVLSYDLNNLKSLTILDLSSNNIGGQFYQLPPNLRKLDISGNSFNGGLPYSISDLSSLEYLSVSRNQFTDPLNDMFSKLSRLATLDLSQNQFRGNLPESFSALSSLTSLYLQNNQFTGTIDVLANLPLENLNIANNRFTGWIPDQLRKIKNLQSDGNQWNSGPAPPPPPFKSPPRGNNGQGSSSNTGDSGGKSSLGAGGIAGIIIAVLVVGSLLAFLLIKKSKSKSKTHKQEMSEGFIPIGSDESAVAKPMQNNLDPPAVILQMQPLSPVHIIPPSFDEPKPIDDEDSPLHPIIKNTSILNVRATVYSIADLQMATNSFSVDNLIGEGSIGRVYRAQFDDGKVLVVKKINSLINSRQATENFTKVVSDISRLRHPNVTELIGYCCEYGQYLLVYEFHRSGSLHDFLHLSDEYSKPLTWNTRVKIALGIARGLEYLHEVCSPSVVHKNFKSANILLDAELSPHLSDCGLSELASDDFQALDQYLGSGYSAPEVAMTGEYTLKSDVFSFGVVMLELLTGRKPFDSSRPRPEQSLVRWATPQLHDIDALDKMVDPALKGLYPAKSLSRFADAIALCVQPEPEFRPPMSEVVQALVRLIQRANMSKQVGAAGDLGRGDEADIHDMF